MGERPPLAVLVSGAPGSGKTTLARALGDRLRLPVAHKDAIKEGRWRTLGQAAHPDGSSVEPFYKTMELWLGLRTSVVGDMTFWRDVSEPDVAARIAPLARLINIHCRTTIAVTRFEHRMRSDPLCNEEHLHRLLPLARRLQDELLEPLDFGCPTILVDTTDGYDPSISAIVAEIDRIYPGPARLRSQRDQTASQHDAP